MELKRAIVCLLLIVAAFAQEDEDFQEEEDSQEGGGLAILGKGKQKKLLEGDLKLKLKTRNGVIRQSQKWTNGIIPYQIDSSYNQRQRTVIQVAMKSIEQKTCIRFIPRSGHSDYVSIKNTNDGCYTDTVGYQRGPTELSLQTTRGSSCMYHEIVVHELLHAVGLYHEHMRYDRDGYVKIHYENVESGLRDQFTKISQSQSSTYNVAYDYTSVMHYDKTAFSKDDRSITIEPLQIQYLNIMGNAKDMSQSDILKVNRMYNCNGNTAGTGAGAGTGSVVQPPLGSNCGDLSAACSSYLSYCGRWALLNTHCRRTCRRC